MRQNNFSCNRRMCEKFENSVNVCFFQKTAVAVIASVVVILKTVVAVVLKLTTAVAVITYNFNSTKNEEIKKELCIKEI